MKHHAPVCRPFTLNTRTHAWKHPYQRRWRPGAPRAGWRAAWGMDSPAQICLILPQAEISVSLSAWEHIYIVPGFLVTLPQDRKWGLSCRSTTWSVHRWKKSQFSSVAQSCPTLCDPMDCSRPGFPVHHQFPEFTQSHVHWVGDAIQPSHPLLSCSSPASIYPSIKVFTNESVFRIRWSKYWGFSFSINPFNEYSGLISFRRDWFDLLAAQGALKSFLQCYSSKASILWYSAFFMVQFSHPYVITGKTIALSIWLLSGSSQIFTLSTYFSLVIMFGRFWKGAWRKQLILKVWTEGNWRLNKLTYIGNYSVKWFFHPV